MDGENKPNTKLAQKQTYYTQTQLLRVKPEVYTQRERQTESEQTLTNSILSCKTTTERKERVLLR